MTSTTSSISSGIASNLYSRSGLPPTGSIGLGTSPVSSTMRVPRPAARMTACMPSLYQTRGPVRRGRVKNETKTVLAAIVHDLATNAFDRTSRRLLAAQAECKAKGKRECDHQSGEQCLHEFGRNAELVQDRQDRRDPDRVLRDRPREIAGVRTGRPCRTRDDILDRLGDDSRENEDQDRYDDLREVEENHLLEEYK